MVCPPPSSHARENAALYGLDWRYADTHGIGGSGLSLNVLRRQQSLPTAHPPPARQSVSGCISAGGGCHNTIVSPSISISERTNSHAVKNTSRRNSHHSGDDRKKWALKNSSGTSGDVMYGWSAQYANAPCSGSAMHPQYRTTSIGLPPHEK